MTQSDLQTRRGDKQGDCHASEVRDVLLNLTRSDYQQPSRLNG
jgi:hypothetical protein